MENTQDIEILLFQENSFPLKVLADQLLLFLDRFRFSVYLLENNPDEVHLALGQGPHLLELLAHGCSG